MTYDHDTMLPMSFSPASALPAAHGGHATPVRRCAACGYDLRGLEQNRCPECGLEFDPNYLPPADVPWLIRRRVAPELEPDETAPTRAPRAVRTGDPALVAYVKTVLMVLLRPRKLGEAVWQEVEVDGAETARFRWVTIGIASGSMLATLLPGMMPLNPGKLLALLILAVPVVLYFFLATGRLDLIHFVADRYDDETRYRRLHELSCAGLALAPIVPVFRLVGMTADWPDRYVNARTVALAAIVLFAWWYGSLRYAIHGGRCSRGDAILHAVLLPFAWFMIAAVICLFALGIVGLVIGRMQ